MTDPSPTAPHEPDGQRAQPESFADAFRAAAARTAIGRGVTGRASVLGAMGGWLGIVEAVVPSIAFLAIYVVTMDLWLSVIGPLALGVVFLAVRLIRRDNPASAIGGIIATGFSALLAAWTGQDTDVFLPGIWTNIAYGGALLISVLVGWPLIGLLVGVVFGEGVAWRADARKRRVFRWLTIMWSALFLARLAAQLPLYFAGEFVVLGTVKLAMGIPLFAPLVVVTWLVCRGLYAVDPPVDDTGAARSDTGTPSA